MGAALLTALEGRQKVAISAKFYNKISESNYNKLNDKDPIIRKARLLNQNTISKISERTIIDVPTIIKEKNKDIIKKIPFVYARIPFSNTYQNVKDYPKFNPLKIFSNSKSESTSQILMDTINDIDAPYGAESKLEITSKKSNFPEDIKNIKIDTTANDFEIKRAIIDQTSILNNPKDLYSILYYTDPKTSSIKNTNKSLNNTTAKILEENSSTAELKLSEKEPPEFADDLIPIQQNNTIIKSMIKSGYSRTESNNIEKKIKDNLHFDEIKKGDILRIGILQENEKLIIVRASIYRKAKHILTIALNDKNDYILGAEPVKIDLNDYINYTQIYKYLPTIYDGIWRGGYSYGMNQNLIQLIIRLLTSSVDLQSNLKPTDFIETFFSINPDNGQSKNDSELLYVNARFGENKIRLYRFQNHDGSIEYFNEYGKSAKPFLLRSPVPSGRITSGFGMRHHPILGYTRVHTGTDWAAPIGTPIIAVSDGKVEKAGWAGGYGKQTIIRHKNGYVSSYNHQDGIAKNIKSGEIIKQGQIIGWIGTTGLSTGPHLHYELIVNGIKVDCMKIRIPEGESLKGETLNRFTMETKRINSLLNSGDKSKKMSR
ncbi:hypothetical protein G653_04286 [Candidatus Liberibacter americanus PW_SP]|nr:hypothetical protein G653_04286 [Candidatus Liberibacter americanus PW_SP]